ncbi:MAG: hypothetical protein NTV33_09260 [Coprothermobacterota bacterium]|nr:hypothetical protein [Coprothermobacterota bacterium]
MIELETSVLQAVLLVDSVEQGERGKKTLKGVFTSIHLSSLPAVASFYLFLRWQGSSDGEHHHILRILNPEGILLSEFKGSFAFPRANAMEELIIYYENLPVRVAGEYRIEALFDGKNAGSLVIPVLIDSQNEEDR